MAQDLELAGRVVGEADGVEIEIDDAAGVEALVDESRVTLETFPSIALAHATGTFNPSANR